MSKMIEQILNVSRGDEEQMADVDMASLLEEVILNMN